MSDSQTKRGPGPSAASFKRHPERAYTGPKPESLPPNGFKYRPDPHLEALPPMPRTARWIGLTSWVVGTGEYPVGGGRGVLRGGRGQCLGGPQAAEHKGRAV